MRPQLLDRFGMCVNVTTMMDGDIRTQMVLDKLAYEMVSGQSSVDLHSTEVALINLLF